MEILLILVYEKWIKDKAHSVNIIIIDKLKTN